MPQLTRQAIARWAETVLFFALAGYVGAYLALGERDNHQTIRIPAQFIEFQSPEAAECFVPLAMIEAIVRQREIRLMGRSGRRFDSWSCNPWQRPSRFLMRYTS